MSSPWLPSTVATSDNGYSVNSDSDGDLERDGRTPSEWIDAVLSYLQFRCGSGWRRGKVRYRQNPRYWEYLDAIRLITEVRYLEVPPCNCAYCLRRFGLRKMNPIPALPLPYPGDKYFRRNPNLEPIFDARGRYVGARERLSLGDSGKNGIAMA
jgi:hypothetical protein